LAIIGGRYISIFERNVVHDFENFLARALKDVSKEIMAKSNLQGTLSHLCSS